MSAKIIDGRDAVRRVWERGRPTQVRFDGTERLLMAGMAPLRRRAG